MAPDTSGQLPRIGDDARSLGVRVGSTKPDIPVSDTGTVSPGSGGMSVSPSKQTIPGHRIPKRLSSLYPDARGSNGDICWRYGDGPFSTGPFAAGLVMRLDDEIPNHGLVEPDREMPLGDYRQAIESTQPGWIAMPWEA